MERAEQAEAWGKVGQELELLVTHPHQSRFRNDYEVAVQKAGQANPWFTPDSIKTALSGLATMLQLDHLQKWLSSYPDQLVPKKKIGIVMAGNIPLAGFHDFLCAMLSGHIVVAKQSSSDKYLLPFIANIFFSFLPEMRSRFVEADRLNEADVMIATGSNNTTRYFEYYFGKLPHIFRKNRNSVAVLTGDENEFDLLLLGRDIFTYFGLGCRSVSKLYVPDGYLFDEFYRNMETYSEVMQHTKYMNNHDYHQALFLLNNEKILTNNFLILRNEKSLSSPVGVLHYEHYTSDSDLENKLTSVSDQLQCVVGKNAPVAFGRTQFPDVSDYADRVDTMAFLHGIYS